MPQIQWPRYQKRHNRTFQNPGIQVLTNWIFVGARTPEKEIGYLAEVFRKGIVGKGVVK